jgi:hypothetical protein
MPALTTTGAVDFGKEIDSSTLAAHVAARLRDVNANDVEVRPNRVTFKGGFFRFVTNWNILVSFGFGDLVVDPDTHEIRYRLSYRQLVIYSAIIFGVMCVFLLSFSGAHGMISGIWTMLGLLLMGFCIGFLNVTIGVWRFERFLSRAIATAPHVEPIDASTR